MRYLTGMALLVPRLAIVLAAFAATAAAAAPATGGAIETRSPSSRYASGGSAQATVSARIINASARVGDGLAPPLARMVPRRTTVSAADGGSVAALIYDFE